MDRSNPRLREHVETTHYKPWAAHVGRLPDNKIVLSEEIPARDASGCDMRSPRTLSRSRCVEQEYWARRVLAQDAARGHRGGGRHTERKRCQAAHRTMRRGSELSDCGRRRGSGSARRRRSSTSCASHASRRGRGVRRVCGRGVALALTPVTRAARSELQIVRMLNRVRGKFLERLG